MSEQQQDYYYQSSYALKQKKNNYLLHIGLFLITFITTTIAGAEWRNGIMGPYAIEDLLAGLPYSIAIMFIISFHEFGHYFAAKYHKVDATLPYYIPFPSIPGFLNFGTMGAVIRTRSPISTKKAMFDIGVAGPISGFIACLIVLIYGFINVPGPEYILAIHADYFSPEYGKESLNLIFGDNLLFMFFRWAFVDSGQFFPPMSEIYHYPYLCVGWFGLFVTAMNMIPIGQLDGGHIGYTLFGEKTHDKIAYFAFLVILTLGLISVIEMIGAEFNFSIGIGEYGWFGWFFWAMIIFFIIKIKHPRIPDDSVLDTKRKILGYFSYFILIISFSPIPFILTVG
ncbi:MAG: site-2 protease family protein [Ignavibacteriaceae bacterium]